VNLRPLRQINIESECQKPTSDCFSKISEVSIEGVLTKEADELNEEGFGVLRQIDVRETLKNKLDVHCQEYKLLSARNPPFTYKALRTENKSFGILLSPAADAALMSLSTVVVAINARFLKIPGHNP
jgi:hypothetical protein